MSADLQRIIEFIVEVDKLKAVLRRTKPVGMARYENSAEHSWQVSLLALLLAPRACPPVNPLRVVEILLVHDIPEIDSGDQIIYQGRSEARREAERAAARRLFGLLPPTQSEWCLSRWEEYEARMTPEAVFAYAVDRLVPVLQNLKNDGQSWRENRVTLEQVLAVNAAVGDALPDVWEHVQKLIAEFAVAGTMGHRDEERS